MKSAFGVNGHDNIVFLSLEAAEDYVIKNYPEFCFGKDATYDLCENMIWEDVIDECGDCGKSILCGDKLDWNSDWCFHESAGIERGSIYE